MPISWKNISGVTRLSFLIGKMGLWCCNLKFFVSNLFTLYICKIINVKINEMMKLFLPTATIGADQFKFLFNRGRCAAWWFCWRCTAALVSGNCLVLGKVRNQIYGECLAIGSKLSGVLLACIKLRIAKFNFNYCIWVQGKRFFNQINNFQSLINFHRTVYFFLWWLQ